MSSSSLVSIEVDKFDNERYKENHRQIEEFLKPGDVKKIQFAPMEQKRYVLGDFRAYTVIDDEPGFEEMFLDLNRTYNDIDIADENLEGLILSRRIFKEELKKGFLAVNFNPASKCFNRVVLAEDYDSELGSILYREIDTGVEKISNLEYLFPIVDEKFRVRPGRHQTITLAGLSHFSGLTTLRKIFETEIGSEKRAADGQLIEHTFSVALSEEELLDGQKTHVLYSTQYPGKTLNDRMLKAVIKRESVIPMKSMLPNHLTFDTYLTYANPNSTFYYTWKNGPIYIYYHHLLLLYKEEILKRINDGSCTLEILEQNPHTLKYFASYQDDGEIYRAQLVQHKCSTVTAQVLSTNKNQRKRDILQKSRFIFDEGDKKRIKVAYIDFGNEGYVNPVNLVPAKDVHQFFESILPQCLKAIYHGEMRYSKADYEKLNYHCISYPMSFAKAYEDCDITLANIMNFYQGNLDALQYFKTLRECLSDVEVTDDELILAYRKHVFGFKLSSSIQSLESSISSDELGGGGG